MGALIVIGIFHVFALINSWYWSFPWMDIPMHIIGGAWVACVGFWYMNSSQRLRDIFASLSDFEKFVILLGFVVLVGIFWEFYEFFYDINFKEKFAFTQGDMILADTLGDLLNDMIGGAIVFLAGKIAFVK